MRLTLIFHASMLVALSLSATAAELAKDQSQLVSAIGSRPSALQPVPTQQYRTLRKDIVTRAEVRMGARLKNPSVSQNGLSPATLAADREQQAYAASFDKNVNSRSPQSAAGCSRPVIRSVNGKLSGAIFMPQPDGNYVIEGCSFGNLRGKVALEFRNAPQLGNRLPIVLALDTRPDAWSDRRILVRMDPLLSNVTDGAVTLAVYLSNGSRLELPGCSFVARRGEPMLLKTLRANWIKLHPSAVRTRPIEQLEFVSPPAIANGAPADATRSSAFVARLDAENFGVGSDVFDLDQLNAGWVIDSVQLQTYEVRCPAQGLNRESFGHWNTQWGERKVAISFEDEVCTCLLPPSSQFGLSFSQYALTIWITGPVGTEPFPGVHMN